MFTSRFSVSLIAGVVCLALAGSAQAAQSRVEPRIMLLRDHPAAGGASAQSVEEIGRVAEASRIAVPELGGHVLVLTRQGEVWAWGDNTSGQLGTGQTAPVSGWIRVEGLGKVVAIAAGAQHSLALLEDGTVWTWGANAMGQLGDGTLLAHLTPRAVPGLAGVVSIAAGALLSAALKDDGSVWVFGSNWADTAPGEPRRLLTRPVRSAGAAIVGAEIEVVNGRVTRREPALPAGLMEQILSGDRSKRLVDAAKGWALAWVEQPVGDAGRESPGIDGSAGVNSSLRGSSALEQAGAAGRLRPMAILSTSKADIGRSHGLAVAANGTVWAWGNNDSGQLGDGTTTPRIIPVRVNGLPGVKAVAAEAYHSLAVATDGKVWVWGANFYGQLGDGTTNSRSTPLPVNGLTDVVAAAAGGGHNLALKSDGKVWAWGSNFSGELGDGTTTNRGTPVEVIGLSSVSAVDTSASHSMALTTDGRVWTWGYNGFGQLGDGTSVNQSTPASVSGLTAVMAIAAGTNHSLAVKNDGTVWAWGANDNGQLGDGTTLPRSAPVQVIGLTGVVAVSSGGNHSLVLKSDGTVWTWGQNTVGQLGDGTTILRSNPVKVTGVTGAVAVAASGFSSLALMSDGKVLVWGSNDFGQLGDGTGTQAVAPARVNLPSGLVKSAGGSAHSLALRSDGTVWSWGYNFNYSLGDGALAQRSTPAQLNTLTGIASLAASGHHNLVAGADGRVWSWGSNYYGEVGNGTTYPRTTPVQLSGLTAVVAVAASENHSLAAASDGSVWAWGKNEYGELGDGTNVQRSSPVQVNGLAGVTAIAAGFYHSLALSNDGRVWAWGNNGVGQLGDGTWTQRNTPVRLPGLTGVVAVAAAGNHSLALRNDGTVWRWGASDPGNYGGGPLRNAPEKIMGLSVVAALAAGSYHNLALRADGTVWAWGENRNGQLGDGTTVRRADPVQVAGLTQVASIAAGGLHSLATRSDGTLWTWGGNSFAQLGDPQPSNRTTPVMMALLGTPDLALTMSHTGNFATGAKASQVLTITNVGLTATTGTITVTDTLPPGLSFYSSTGTGWTCSAASQTVTCTNAGPINPGASSTITLTVNVGASAYPGVTNVASVSNSSDLNLSNNTAGDPAVVTTPPGFRFVAVTPCRVVDTRNASGPLSGPFMAGNSTRSFALPQGTCGIPISAQAYSLNVTVVPRGPLEWLTLWPTGQSQPWVSTLNSFGGEVVANAAIVPAGTNGAVSVFVTNNTDVILDINGYFDNSAGASFYADTPCRVVDTRWPAGPLGGPGMNAGQTRSFTVPSGGCAIPTNATAYAMNYTVVPSGYLSYLTTWPAGQSRPYASTLNSWQGKVVANAAIVPAGTGGAVSVFASDPTQVIVDINGHFAASGGAGALSFYPVTPCRVADTRGPAGPFGGPILGGGSTRTIAVPQSPCGIPATAKAYSMNVTVLPAGPLWYLTTWPAGGAQPYVSTLNSPDGAVLANAAIVPAGTNGAISFFVTHNTHVALDINGYFQ